MSATVTLRAASGGKVQFQGRAEDLPPDQLVKLRAYRDELAPLIAAYGKVQIVIGPAAAIPPAPTWPPAPPTPDSWLDHDGWLACLRGCNSVATRRAIVVAWAWEAGGFVEGGILALPENLPRGLALAELKTQGRIAGLKVQMVPVCGWCPNAVLPGDILCDACRWLAGSSA